MENQLLNRLAIDTDAETLSQMICQNAKTTLRPHYNDNQWSVFLRYYSPAAMRIKIKQQYTFCAELDGRIVGSIALDKDFVVGFYTRLEYLNQGIGKFLMQHLEKFALSRDVYEIRLAASPEGLSFYYKHGWNKVKDITIEHYGVGFKETLMVKQLKRNNSDEGAE